MADAVVQLRCGVKVCPMLPMENRHSYILITLIQNDDWGKKGKESIVAQLWSKSPGSDGIDESKHYSEVSLRYSNPYNRLSGLMDMTRCGWGLTRRIHRISCPRANSWGITSRRTPSWWASQSWTDGDLRSRSCPR